MCHNWLLRSPIGGHWVVSTLGVLWIKLPVIISCKSFCEQVFFNMTTICFKGKKRGKSFKKHSEIFTEEVQLQYLNRKLEYGCCYVGLSCRDEETEGQSGRVTQPAVPRGRSNAGRPYALLSDWILSFLYHAASHSHGWVKTASDEVQDG